MPDTPDPPGQLHVNKAAHIRFTDRAGEHWRFTDGPQFGQNWLVCDERADRGYRHLPAVEAEFGPLTAQLTRDNAPQVLEWANSQPVYGPGHLLVGLAVNTPNGRVTADFGNWITKTVSGFHVHTTPTRPRR